MYSARAFAATAKVYSIKMGNKHVCAHDVTGNNQMHYAIGFQNMMIARNVMYGMSPDPDEKVTIVRSRLVDVSNDVNNGLHDLMVPSEFRIENLLIDMDASIIVPKADRAIHGNNSGVPENGFHLSTEDTSDFLAYPFDHSIGIAMPLYLLEEDSTKYILKTVIVEACYCAARKKANLKKMMEP